jgi:hypothetical protein
MLQLERNAEFLRKIRAGLDASEERAAEQELGNGKSFFGRRVCKEFRKLLGLILNASRSVRAHHFNVKKIRTRPCAASFSSGITQVSSCLVPFSINLPVDPCSFQ